MEKPGCSVIPWIIALSFNSVMKLIPLSGGIFFEIQVLIQGFSGNKQFHQA